jgi:hypothetical protein
VLEDMFGSFLMKFVVGGEDKEVIHVDDEPSFSDHVLEGVIHESLEGRGGVGKSEEYYRGFKEAFVGDEGGLPLVSVFDLDIVVSPSNVELSERLGILEFVDEVGDEGKGVGVTDRVFIDVMVVLAGSESSILFLTKKKGAAWGELDGRIFPVARFSSRKVSVAALSSGERE